jgi:hypothetical protein
MGYTPITPSSGTIHACIKHPIVGVVILLLVVAVPSYFNAEPVSNCTQPMITFTFDEVIIQLTVKLTQYLLSMGIQEQYMFQLTLWDNQDI